MNKYQEALDRLVKHSCPQKTNCRVCKIRKSCNATAKDWIDTLQELVDKAKPKKLIYNEEIDEYRCKQCGHLVIEGWRAKKYCSNCQQAILWGDEK